MARYKFPSGTKCPARLHGVLKRPLENRGLSLVRLEFEVFHVVETPDRPTLQSTGKIACRDLAVGPALNPSLDEGITRWTEMLGIKQPASQIETWLNLVAGSKSKRPWVRITFGEMTRPDYRCPFRNVEPFDSTGYRICPYVYPSTGEWCQVGDAAECLGCSEATVRRLVAFFEPDWGELLVRRTCGNHRRINLQLLQHLRQEQVE